jgi:pilus assembly protein CpaC
MDRYAPRDPWASGAFTHAGAGRASLSVRLAALVAVAACLPAAAGQPTVQVVGVSSAQEQAEKLEAPAPRKADDLPKDRGSEVPAMPEADALGPGPLRLPFAPCEPPRPPTPSPTPATKKRFDRFVEKQVEPDNTLDVTLGRQTILVLKQAPKRVLVPDETVITFEQVSPRELAISGKKVGSTVLTLWFPDPDDPKKEVILSYLVRVRLAPGTQQDPRARLEDAYKQLEQQINCAFPDSVVHLNLIGSRLVLSGQAKDRPDAEAILRLVQGNAPGQRGTVQTAGVNVNLNVRPGDLDPDVVPAGGLERLLQTRAPTVVNLLRVPGEQQVLLRVTVAEVNRTAARSVGVNFSIFNRNGLQVFANNTGNVAGGTQGGGGGAGGVGGSTGSGGGTGGLGSSTNNLPTVLDNGRIIAAINALRNLDFARSLAEPTLVAMHGQTASFQAGGTFPVPVVTGATLNGLQGVQFIPFGVQVSFQPFISDKDRIRLSVQANVSTRNPATGANVGGTNVPGTNTRNFTTTVEMREGQTIAVAGLIQNDFGADASRVPFFGDLPVFGRLFAFDRTSAGEQELVILITPELVHPLDCNETPPLPGADLFEPGDVEFYLGARLESRRPYDYRSPAMTDLARMARYRHCEQIFIFGPNGHSDGRPCPTCQSPISLPSVRSGKSK